MKRTNLQSPLLNMRLDKLKKIEKNQHDLVQGLDAIIQTIDFGITLQDRKGSLVYANQAAAAIMGMKSVMDIIQTPTHVVLEKFELFDKRGKPFPPRLLPGTLVMKGKPTTHRIVRYVNRNTLDERWAEVGAAPIYETNGEIAFVVNTFKDITEQKIEEQKRDQFIAIASHELKTPLTTIKALNQAVIKNFNKKDTTDVSHHLVKIDMKVNELTDIINEFLDLNKARAQKLDILPELADLNQLVSETVSDLQRVVKKHHLSIHGSIDRPVYIDKARIGLVLSNLIRNASKYSPQGTDIIITMISLSKKVKVCVKDFGQGIPPESRQKIFEPFYRVEGAGDRYVTGMGLGLYIANEIIKLHGGKIWVKSAVGKGSTFCFTLSPIPSHSHNVKRGSV